MTISRFSSTSRCHGSSIMSETTTHHNARIHRVARDRESEGTPNTLLLCPVQPHKDHRSHLRPQRLRSFTNPVLSTVLTFNYRPPIHPVTLCICNTCSQVALKNNKSSNYYSIYFISLLTHSSALLFLHKRRTTRV